MEVIITVIVLKYKQQSTKSFYKNQMIEKKLQHICATFCIDHTIKENKLHFLYIK